MWCRFWTSSESWPSALLPIRLPITFSVGKEGGYMMANFGCRKRGSCVDAVAVLMNRTQQAWGEELKMMGALPVDVRSAFSNASKAQVGGRMEKGLLCSRYLPCGLGGT